MFFLLLSGGGGKISRMVFETLRGDVDFQRKDVHMLVVIVSTALEEALDTLGGDVDFRRKGVSCAA